MGRTIARRFVWSPPAGGGAWRASTELPGPARPWLLRLEGAGEGGKRLRPGEPNPRCGQEQLPPPFHLCVSAWLWQVTFSDPGPTAAGTAPRESR